MFSTRGLGIDVKEGGGEEEVDDDDKYTTDTWNRLDMTCQPWTKLYYKRPRFSYYCIIVRNFFLWSLQGHLVKQKSRIFIRTKNPTRVQKLIGAYTFY